MVLTMCQYNLSLNGAFSGGRSLILGLEYQRLIRNGGKGVGGWGG